MQQLANNLSKIVYRKFASTFKIAKTRDKQQINAKISAGKWGIRNKVINRKQQVIQLLFVDICVVDWKHALRICWCEEDINLNPRYELDGQGKLARNTNLIFFL